MTYKRSNEPLVWSMFGAGGMAAAFLLPAIIIACGLMLPFELLATDAMTYSRVMAFSSHLIGKLCWLTVIALPLWHAMHRIYHGLHDFKVGARMFFFCLCYGFALLVSLLTALLLYGI